MFSTQSIAIFPGLGGSTTGLGIGVLHDGSPLVGDVYPSPLILTGDPEPVGVLGAEATTVRLVLIGRSVEPVLDVRTESSTVKLLLEGVAEPVLDVGTESPTPERSAEPVLAACRKSLQRSSFCLRALLN